MGSHEHYQLGYLSILLLFLVKHVIRIKRIHHYCEGGVEKSVPRITDWHHQACPVMTSYDQEGRIFLSHHHTNNGFFFFSSPLSNSLYIRKT